MIVSQFNSNEFFRLIFLPALAENVINEEICCTI